VCDNADTEHSAHTPELSQSAGGARGCAASDDGTARLVRELAAELHLEQGERELLRLVLEHVATGGIILYESEGIVLTWPDGGVAHRLANPPGD
jgi:hypothetical protein